MHQRRATDSAYALGRLIEKALHRRVPMSVVAGSANKAKAYTALAYELQQFLAGKRREIDAAEALRRFEEIA